MFRRPKIFAAALLALMLGGMSLAHAVDAPKVTPAGARQMTAIKALSLSRNASDAKLDSRLYWAVLSAQRDVRMAQFPDLRIMRAEADGRVPVDVIVNTAASVKPTRTLIDSLGGVVKDSHLGFRRISARLPIGQLQALAASADVKRIRQAIPGVTSSMKMTARDIERGVKVPRSVAKWQQSKGATNVSEGDATHGGPAARAFYGVNGTGVKICVLSDGVDSLAASVASGDLPAGIDVLTGQAGGGDEGTAMLEIVHDLAPGATLGFATAATSEASFAQNILDLATAGCNIIVDDIIYLDESPFQDGPVSQSVNTVTAAGVLYFSSAGNEGNGNDLTSGTWEGDFLLSAAADPALLPGADLHDFGDGGNSILIEVGGGAPALLIWAEHYDLATGTASTDFDIYDMDGALTTLFDASTDVQDGAGGDDFPIEFIGGFGVFSGERLLIDRWAAGTTSSVPAMNLIVFRGELDDALVTPGTTRGHSAAADAYSVAATPAGASFDGTNPGPFPGLFTAANTVEVFSSDGPRRILLSPTGVELTPGNRTISGGVVRQKPDITAADGVATAAPGFNPFYGTSAAAPHAAAIAGLLKSAVPASTPVQVRAALIASAIDIEAAGVDIDSGAGIIMAQAALAAIGAVPQSFLSAGTAVATQVAGDGDGTIEPNEDFSLVIPLTNDGGVAATAISAVLASATPGVSVYQAASAYPNLNPTASAPNTTAYLFNVGSAVPCGATLNFTLTVTYTGGPSPQVFNVSFATGGLGAPVTVAYAGAPVAIPDAVDLSGTAPGALVSASLPVAVAGNLKDINLSIDGATCSTTIGSTTVGIDHTFVNDLEISLQSPSGAIVKVIDNTDGSGNNLCQTVLDDESAGANIQSVVTANAPFTGSFTPANSLAALDGLAATGNWLLSAQDFFSGDTGSIRAWSLAVTPAVCDVPVQAPNLTATKTVTGTYIEGSVATYTVVITNTGTGIQPDNAGAEFTDTIPAALTVGTPTATAGTVSGAGVNPVTWNGILLPGASVTLTIPTTINPGTGGTLVSNQGSLSFDANRDGTNEATASTDDPGVAGAANPTTFTAIAQADLLIGLTSSSPQTAVNVPVTFTATSLNQGPSTAQDVSITVTLTPDFRYSSHTATGATSCSTPAVGNTGLIVCTWAGATAINVTRRIDVVAYSNVAGDIAVNASTTSNTTDPGPGANAAGIVVRVGALVEGIPALNGFGLMLLGLMLGVFGVVTVRRQA